MPADEHKVAVRVDMLASAPTLELKFDAVIDAFVERRVVGGHEGLVAAARACDATAATASSISIGLSMIVAVSAALTGAWRATDRGSGTASEAGSGGGN